MENWVRTKQFGACAKREVSRDDPMASSMLTGGHRRGSGPLAVLLLVVVSTVLATSPVVVHSGAAAASPRPTFLLAASAPVSAAFSWSNGVVLLSFPRDAPAYSLSSVADPSVVVNQSLSALAEVSPIGRIVSFASFSHSGTLWSLDPIVGTNATTVALTATVPVVNSSGEWESGDDGGSNVTTLGNATAVVRFTLNDSSGPQPSTVSYSLNVTSWPWLNASDSLGVEVRTNLTSAVGYWQASGSNSLTGVSRSSQSPIAAFTWESSAVAHYQGGGEDDSSVSSYHNFSGNYSSSLVRLSFGAVPGNYSSLSYDPWLEVLSPVGFAQGLATVVLTPLSLSALALGGAVVAGLAYVARRRRTPPEEGL